MGERVVLDHLIDKFKNVNLNLEEVESLDIIVSFIQYSGYKKIGSFKGFVEIITEEYPNVENED